MRQRKCRYDAEEVWTGGFPSEHSQVRPFHILCLTIVLLQLQGRLDRDHDFFAPREARIILVGDQRFGGENRLCPAGAVR